MDLLSWNLDDDLEDETSTENPREWYGRHGIVFLIDCSLPMLTKNENNHSYLELVLTGIKDMLCSQIMGRTKNCSGIVFYGVNCKDKTTGFDNIKTVLEVKEPSAENILKIEELVEFSEKEFEEKFGNSSDYSIANGIWHCSSLLTNSGFKFGAQKIILATCNDEPYVDSSNEKLQLHRRTCDLLPLKIDFELLALGDSFNISRFYKQILSNFMTDEDLMPKPVSTLQNIVSKIQVTDSKTRSFGNMNFYLEDDLYFGVSVFKLFRKTTLPSSTKLHRVHNEPIKTVTRIKEAVTEEIMLPSEITKSVTVANEEAHFTEDEIKSIAAACGKYGFKLLGFKDLDKIPFYHHSQSSLFIIAAEKKVKGSETLFLALRDCMLERKQVALCYLVARRGASPKLVYLQAQKEKVENNVQILPDGFHVIFLPFADQIRNELVVNEVPASEPELNLGAKRMVNELSCEYSPSMFKNPKVNTFWAGLEAMALDRSERKEVMDNSNPKAEEIDGAIKNLAVEFNRLLRQKKNFIPADQVEKRSADSRDRSPKKIKRDENLSDLSIEDLVRNGKIEKVTVPNLKLYLNELGVKHSSSIKKAELVDLIRKQF